MIKLLNSRWCASALTSGLLGLAVLAAPGCSRFFPSSTSSSDVKDASTFDPAPVAGQEASIEAQLKRFPGQTQFLNPARGGFGWGGGRGPMAERAATNSQRAVQEADVFKIGRPGSKQLFLLNNYRGLQVVSFQDGALAPKILGRAEATGNWPNDMYMDPTQDRIYVLETVWYDEGGQYNEQEKSRVLTYDVSNPAAPKISQVVELNGTIADSRMVGQVLYVATSERPRSSGWGWRRAFQQEKGVGHVFAIKTGGDSTSLVGEQTLTLPVSSRENMNIVEVEANGAWNYYLVAILSESGWGWWDRQSVVEVVDISDANGKIVPVMVASARGGVRERSQTHIKNNTLLVTSNYANEGSNIQRVSVETFAFPGATPDVLSADEAQFRRLNIERTINKKKTELEAAGTPSDIIGDKLDALRTQLIADADLGIKGRFVKNTGTGALQKLMPDSVVTVGSTEGMSASLQDVRYDGNNLYVFWVPSNNIDPLDLFDISNPTAGAQYKGRLQFDGWIQRAIPTTYEGRDFIIGLGWVIPAVNNENQRRYPQTVLFEVKRNGTQLTATQVAQMSLENSHYWANLNDGDKFIETRLGADGKGSVMFPVETWDTGSWLSGGKLIGVDLAAAVAGQADKVFAEGGMIAGSEGWLRRVFTNSEISKVNTFSDEELGTFDSNGSIGDAQAIFQAANILELARNIVAYATVRDGAVTMGVQVISKNDWWYNRANQKTVLRLVDVNGVDAERNTVAQEITLQGSYRGHFVNPKDGSLVVLSRTTESHQNGDTNIETNTNHLTKYVLAAASRTLTQQTALSWPQATNSSDYWSPWSYRTSNPLIALDNGDLLINEGTLIKRIALEATGLTVTDLTISCAMPEGATSELLVLGGKPWMHYSVQVNDSTRENVSYTRHFVAAVALEGAGTCGAGINIPGEPMGIISGSQLVSNDVRLVDIVEHKNENYRWFEVVTETNLASTAVIADAGKAVLADLYHSEKIAPDAMTVRDNSIIYLESTQDSEYTWSNSPAQHLIYHVTLAADGSFRRESFVLNLPASGARLLTIADQGSARYAVVSNGRSVTAVRWATDNLRPSIVKLSEVLADGSRSEAKESVTLPNSWVLWGYSAGERIHFTETLKSFEIAQDLSGLKQLMIVE